MSLSGMAKETLRICEEGRYTAPSGRVVEIGDAIEAAREGTRLYRPGDALDVRSSGSGAPRITFTTDKTGDATRRLVQEEGIDDVLLLNFASARNPGGGFLGGAKAQEEDLARCSALYVCQLTQPDYYEANRACRSLIYTDHLLWSPRVPFFRSDDYALLDEPFFASVITAPAPNAGEELRRNPGSELQIREALRHRAALVLRLAAACGHRTLVLGAWGCGVFRNDPEEVAEAWRLALDALPGCFDRIVFAVYERGGDGHNIRTFRRWFA
jgi:uncharacterized protein (TIGR02452 family)